MASEIDICNVALALIGEQSIASFSDGTKQADACNSLYENTRNLVIADFKPNCAVDRAQLSQLSGDGVPLNEWAYAYQLPADCLRPRRWTTGDVQDDGTLLWTYFDNEKDQMPHSIEGRKLLCDADEVYLVYIKKVTDVNDLTEHVKRLLALYLASDLIGAINPSENMAKLIERKIEVFEPKARIADAEDSGIVQEVDVENAWTDSR